MFLVVVVFLFLPMYLCWANSQGLVDELGGLDKAVEVSEKDLHFALGKRVWRLPLLSGERVYREKFEFAHLLWAGVALRFVASCRGWGKAPNSSVFESRVWFPLHSSALPAFCGFTARRGTEGADEPPAAS